MFAEDGAATAQVLRALARSPLQELSLVELVRCTGGTMDQVAEIIDFLVVTRIVEEATVYSADPLGKIVYVFTETPAWQKLRADYEG